MAALAALYPAKLQKVATFDRFGHYRLETGEQLLVWTPIYPAGPLPLIIYLHGASSGVTTSSKSLKKARAVLQRSCAPATSRRAPSSWRLYSQQSGNGVKRRRPRRP